MISGWRNALFAASLVLGMGVVVSGYARVIDLPVWRGLYDQLFAFVPGHWIANRLNLVEGDEGGACLFVGTSVVREGLDADILASAMGGPLAVNIGTTAPFGAAGVFEVQAEITAERSKQFKCVVIGFNAYYLYDFIPESFDLTSTDYLSQLSPSSLISLSGVQWLWPQFPAIAAKTTYPLGRHSLILQRIHRRAIFGLHEAWVGRLAQTDFETFAGELETGSPYLYSGPSIYADAVKKMEVLSVELGLGNPDRYDGEGPTRSFRRAVEIFGSLTDRLYILNMPLTHVYDSAEAAASGAYRAAMAGLPIDGVLNCAFRKDEEPEVFYDSGHLNAGGRLRLSLDVGAMLSTRLNQSAQRVGDVCAWL